MSSSAQKGVVFVLRGVLNVLLSTKSGGICAEGQKRRADW